ncbi:uncharacterized protein K02A2.6-like [Frankliniella occidentalis]|uniref:RNA-directed DNA polymerase n=1 Tax=Frankliniella occidentalis TaxID=133901 RepID=A0A9C6WVU8_FRAOC|nr:uncharacterized protein K02A2.6-like [Frankliniella occidentalis]
MALVPPPQSLSLGGKLEESWAAFKDDIEIYLQANKVEDDKAAAGVLLTFIGREARNHFKNWKVTDADKLSYKKLIEAIDKVVKPTSYPIHNRLMFRSRRRMDGENIDDYVVHLRQRATECEFVNGMEELMIIDNIVESVTDPGLQQHLFKQASKGKDASDIVKLVKEHETLTQATSSMNGKIHHLSRYNQHYQNNYKSRSKSPRRHYYENYYEGSSKSPKKYSKSPSRYQSKSPSRYQSKSPHHRRSSRDGYEKSSRGYSHRRSSRDKYRRSASISPYKKSGSKSPHRRASSPAPDSFRKKPCRRCQTRHEFGECPAEGATCNNCGRRNHFTQCCLLRKVDSITVQQESKQPHGSMSGSQFKKDPYYYINTLTQRKNSDEDNTVHIKMLRSVPDEDPSIWIEPIEVCNKIIKFKIDTGSDVDTLPIQHLSIIPDDCIIKPAPRTLAYGEVEVPVLGKVQLPSACRGTKTTLDFVIIGTEEVPVLSRTTSLRLGLIKRVHASTPVCLSVQTKKTPHCEDLEKTLECITDETARHLIRSNKQLFVGTGKFPDKVTLLVDKDVEPTRHPPRRVPLIIEEKVKKYINKISVQEVVSPVEQPRSWVSHMLIREKPNGDIRVCLDPKDLNQAIKRNYYQIPSVEFIQSRLAGNEFFSVVDLKDGFWHCELDLQSSEVCAFSTPFGCYKFNRLPFGLNASPEIFQARCEFYFGDIPGVTIFFDDIIVSGRNREEHDKALYNFLQRATLVNARINASKIQIRKTSVKYVGHIFSKEGRTVDPTRVEAIQKLKSPLNKKQLQKILGSINYEREYIPNLATLMQVLRPLLEEKNKWMWLECHEEALQKIKDMITNAPILANFQENAPIVIQCDASSFGLGSCLLQNKKPVSFASRCLTKTEQGYAMVEKEMLAILFSARKFHFWIYGREVTVHTDHKPLVTIFKKNVPEIGSTRLQSLRIKLLMYKLNVQYIPGSQMYIADLLSRDPLPEEKSDEVLLNVVIHTMTNLSPISGPLKDKIREESNQDEELQMLKRIVLDGWPEAINKVEAKIKPYWQKSSDIHLDNNLLFYGQRVIIPVKLRKGMLEKLHEGHQRISKTSKLAALSVYWPNIQEDITSLLQACQTCSKHQPKNFKQPMEKRTLPTRPWSHLAADILYCKGENYLIVMDCYSKWLEIIKIKSKSAETINEVLSDLFSRYGFPDIIYSDNNPFNSQVCLQLADTGNFKYIFSSPRYPQSNGQAEKAVGIARQIITKSKESNEDYKMGLLNYRNTPIDVLNASPSQLLNSRVLKCKIPMTEETLKPKVQEGVNRKLVERQERSEKQYNKTAKRKIVTFQDNDKVLVYTGENWEPAIVVKKNHENPRSYEIKTNHGTYVRTTHHMKKRFDNRPIQSSNYYQIYGPNKDNIQEMSEANAHSESRNGLVQPNQGMGTPRQQLGTPTAETRVETPQLRRTSRVTKPPARYSQ